MFETPCFSVLSGAKKMKLEKSMDKLDEFFSLIFKFSWIVFLDWEKACGHFCGNSHGFWMALFVVMILELGCSRLLVRGVLSPLFRKHGNMTEKCGKSVVNMLMVLPDFWNFLLDSWGRNLANIMPIWKCYGQPLFAWSDLCGDHAFSTITVAIIQVYSQSMVVAFAKACDFIIPLGIPVVPQGVWFQSLKA